MRHVFAFAAAFAATTASAQQSSTAPAADVPEVATEIVIEDLQIVVKRLRIGVALSPEQIENITKVLRGAEAEVSPAAKDPGASATE